MCPQCQQPTCLDGTNPWRPFCCERCKLLDLGEWFDESRAISAAEPADWTADQADLDPPYQ